MSKDNVRRGFVISRGMNDKLIELQEQLGMKTITGVLEYCISFTYKKEIENYVNVQKNRTPRIPMSVEDRIEMTEKKYIEKKNVASKLKEDRGMEIARELDANIEEDSAGNKIARWKVYQKENPHYVSVGELTRLVSDLTDEYIGTQYRDGTKADIKRILKEMN